MSALACENNPCHYDPSSPASAEAKALFHIFYEMSDVLLDVEQFLMCYIDRLRDHTCSCDEHQAARNYIDDCRMQCLKFTQKLSDLYQEHNLDCNLPVVLGIAFEKVRSRMMTMMQTRILPKIREIKESTPLECTLKGEEGHSCQ